MQTSIFSMRMLPTLLGISTVVAIGLSASAANSQPAPGPSGPAPAALSFVYAAKYICGRAAILPNQPPPPVVPGTYGSAINVLNAGPSDVMLEFRKRFVIALPGEKQGGFISQWFPAALKLDEAFEIDCPDIFKHLPQPPPAFAKGFVIIDSPQSLEIVGVYTAGPAPNGPTASIAVERVPRRP
jgi:hypothetical protein